MCLKAGPHPTTRVTELLCEGAPELRSPQPVQVDTVALTGTGVGVCGGCGGGDGASNPLVEVQILVLLFVQEFILSLSNLSWWCWEENRQKTKNLANESVMTNLGSASVGKHPQNLFGSVDRGIDVP